MAPRAPAAGLRVQQAPRPIETIGKRQPGVDDYSWRRFTQGSFKVERRLDLHGMVAQEAFHRLMEFMDVATHRGLRCVEIITGLGTGRKVAFCGANCPIGWKGQKFAAVFWGLRTSCREQRVRSRITPSAALKAEPGAWHRASGAGFGQTSGAVPSTHAVQA